MDNYTPKTGWCIYLAAVFLPMTVFIVWLTHNTQLSTADAVGMFYNSSTVYRHAINGDWSEFFKGL